MSLHVVGIGFGPDQVTGEAARALAEADVVIGHPVFLRSVAEIIDAFLQSRGRPRVQGRPDRHRETYDVAEREELGPDPMSRRATAAMAESEGGRRVVVVSGGDPGLLGMAGPLLRCVAKSWGAAAADAVVVVPGLSAAAGAAALVGAPLNGGFSSFPLCLDTQTEAALARQVRGTALSGLAACVYMLRHNGEYFPHLYATDEDPAAITARRLDLLHRGLSAHRGGHDPVFLVSGVGVRDEVAESSVERLPELFGRIAEDSLLLVAPGDWERVGSRIVAVT